MVRIKHALNDPRGDEPDPTKTDLVFNPRYYKSLELQQKWVPEFKERKIITGREFERSFSLEHRQRMLAPMSALGWNGFLPLPTNVYSKLVRLFYCNLEIGNLDNAEYTVDSLVRNKTIVLTPTTLSEITGIANEGDFVFISKPSHLKRYVRKRDMLDVIAGKDVVKVTETIHLRKEFRLFHRFIAHNIIPKAGHLNQVTTMDAFIVYRAAIEKPLNLNYIILKEMADVRNHKTRSFPFGALLTKIFIHFNVNLRGMRVQEISKGFSINTIKQGIDFIPSSEEREVEMEYENMEDFASIRAMNINRNQDIISVQANPNTQNLGEEEGYGSGQLNKNIPMGENMEEDSPSHRAQSFHQGTSSHGGAPVWVLELQASLGEIKQQQAKIMNQQAEIIQNQKRQHEHMGCLESAFYGIRNDVDRIQNLFVEQGSKIDTIGNTCESIQSTQEERSQTFTEIQDQLAGIWHVLNPPPYIPFDPNHVPPPSQPYYRQPPY